jgi:hypothetical protein
MLEMIICSSVGNSSLLDWQGLSWFKLLDIIFYAYFNKTFTCANPLHRPDYLLWAGGFIQIIFHAESLLSIKILLMLNVSYPHWGLIFRFRSRRVVFPKQSRMTMLTVEADHHRQKRDQNS